MSSVVVRGRKKESRRSSSRFCGGDVRSFGYFWPPNRASFELAAAANPKSKRKVAAAAAHSLCDVRKSFGLLDPLPPYFSAIFGLCSVHQVSYLSNYRVVEFIFCSVVAVKMTVA